MLKKNKLRQLAMAARVSRLWFSVGIHVALILFCVFASLQRIDAQSSIAKPVASAATNVGSYSFTANWSSTGVSTYLVDVSLSDLFTSFVYRNQGVNALSYTFQNLSPGTTYYYRVRAFNGSAYSDYSNVIAVNTTQPPPSAPEITSASLITTSSFRANWKLSSSATSYEVELYRVGNSTRIGAYPASGNYYNFSSLVAGTEYYYRVRAGNGFGWSGWSSSPNVITVPPAPTATAATEIELFSFKANWNSTTGAEVYLIDVSETSSFSTYVLQNHETTGPSTVTVPVNNKTYYYRVRAKNKSGISVYSNVISAKVLTYGPSQVWSTNVTTNQFTANWTSYSNAISYHLQVSTDPVFSTILMNYPDLNTLSKIITGLQSGTTYYFRVRVKLQNEFTDFTGSSTVTKPSAPIVRDPTNITQSSFTANWSEVPGAIYLLEISKDNFQTILSSHSVTSTSKDITGLSAGTSYHYRVRAYITYYSDYSDVALALTKPAAPYAAYPSNRTPTSFTANWSSVVSATSYLLDVATTPGFDEGTYIIGFKDRLVNGTSQGISGLSISVIYYYRVRAVNGSGRSDYSNTRNVFLSENFIKTEESVVGGITSKAQMEQATKNEKVTVTQFFNGLGVLTQTVSQQASPAGYDIVQPVTYDKLGREHIKYFPYVDGTNGWYKDNAITDPAFGREFVNYNLGAHYKFYQEGIDMARDPYPYSEQSYEGSPLSRPVRDQGAGADWRSENKGINYTYRVNVHGTSAGQERIVAWRVNESLQPERQISQSGLIEPGGYYSTGQLSIKTVKDEDGNEVREYSTKLGKIILKKVQAVENAGLNNDSHWAQTYYIYDDSGNLAFVLSPEATRLGVFN